jgi:hypothetical protein
VSVLPADYWPSLVGVLWRGIFEPLSRHAAYVDAENQKPSDESQLHLQPFYRAVLGRHCTTTRGALRRSFESDLLATDEVTVEILEVMRALLEEVGVTYRKMPGGECWIEVR